MYAVEPFPLPPCLNGGALLLSSEEAGGWMLSFWHVPLFPEPLPPSYASQKRMQKVLLVKKKVLVKEEGTENL